MKLTSILGAPSAAFLILAAGAAEARRAAAMRAPTSGVHDLNPQPPPG
jgi:hypothetical protein